jgi:hypothetical protein
LPNNKNGDDQQWSRSRWSTPFMACDQAAAFTSQAILTLSLALTAVQHP